MAKLELLPLWLSIVLSLPILSAAQTTRGINVLFVNDESNSVAEKALDVALNYVRRTASTGIQFDSFLRVSSNTTDAKTLLEALCDKYDNSLKTEKGPDLVLDFTQTGVSSETVKSFTHALALPTVSASYGQDDDLRQWHFLSDDQLKYLVQVSPPADMIPEVIRSIVLSWNISNAGILFDDSFVMDHKYKSLLQNVPTRHLIAAVEEPRSLKRQLNRLRDLDIVNFFVLGRLNTLKNVLDAANANKFFGRKFAWFAITQEKGQLKCSATNATILFLKPEPDPTARERLEKLRTDFSLTVEPEIASAFYFDLSLRAFMAVKQMMDKNQWPRLEYTSCEEYEEENPVVRKGYDLRRALREVQEPPSYASINVEDRNGHSFMEASMRLEKVTVMNGQSVSAEVEGSWKLGLDSPLMIKDVASISNLTAASVYRIVTVIQKPFVMKKVNADGREEYEGYCIDLLKEIAQVIMFEYEIYVAPDNKFGNMDEKGQWDGLIKELMEKRADIGLGSLAVMAERENVIDFTVPYYDLVGISILMKKPDAPTSLFKFLTVLETDVWLCILAAYFFTSFLMWVFDRWSPYSYQNNREKYKDDEEKREFNLKECLWFCMTSLTPQGGGEAPKNLSGRLVAATWWLFGFIIIASYTANLAAFLTVSRLDTPVESLEDLSKQYKIQYAPHNGSSAMTYFQRMADIETRFYEIWKDMSLNDSLSEVERAKLAVWDYPVGDKYTKMWQAMLDAKMPEDLDAAVKRVRSSVSSSDGFAYLGDATDIRWLSQTSCDLQMVGEEFSRKPYAIAVQQGSPLKDQFNNAILQLLNKRKLEKLKERWWSLNPEIKKCDKQDDQQDGISIQNIGGVFIVIFVGIGLACVTLAFEYYWYKYKRNPRVTDLAGGPLPNAPRVGKGGGLGGQQQGRLAVIGRPDEQAAKLDAATLGQVLGQGYNYRRNGNQLPGVNQAWQH